MFKISHSPLQYTGTISPAPPHDGTRSLHMMGAPGKEFTMSSIEKQFLITGVSSGFGRAFAQAALEKGHRVVGTVRNDDAIASFERLAPGRATAVRLDVTDMEAIEPAVAGIERTIGPVDVLINNAGYGHEGTLEESP